MTKKLYRQQQSDDQYEHSPAQDWVYGLHAVESLLKHNADSIQQLMVQQGRHDQRIDPLLQRAYVLARQRARDANYAALQWTAQFRDVDADADVYGQPHQR